MSAKPQTPTNTKKKLSCGCEHTGEVLHVTCKEMERIIYRMSPHRRGYPHPKGATERYSQAIRDHLDKMAKKRKVRRSG